MTMDKMYLAASAAFSATNLRFSLLSRIHTDDSAAKELLRKKLLAPILWCRRPRLHYVVQARGPHHKS
jgi:hypothetical protein